eukprot:Awhi_evm1s2640
MLDSEREANSSLLSTETFQNEKDIADSIVESIPIEPNSVKSLNKYCGSVDYKETNEPSQDLLYATYITLIEALFKYGTPSLHLPMYA